MTELDLWGPRVAWPNHFDSGDVIVVPPFAFAKSRTHCIAIELESKTVTGSVELDDLDPVLSFAADCHSGSVVFLTAHRQGCQMAKFDPFLSLDCTRVEGVGMQSKERKGSNFAV